MRKSDKLIEATILALQGKLDLNESKSKKSEARDLTVRQKKLIKQYAKDQADGKDPQWYKLIRDLEAINDYETLNQDAERFLDDLDLDESKSKKQESIDVNVNDDTTVSVEGNDTIVDTSDATVIVSKKEDDFVPETSDDETAGMEAPEVDAEVAPETDNIPADNIETTDDTVELPVSDTVMPEDLTDEPIDTALPDEETDTTIDDMVEESKKVESAVTDGAEHIKNDDRYANNLTSVNGMLADKIANIAEDLGDDYSEFIGKEDILEIIDTIVASSLYNDFINQLDDLIKETIIAKVYEIRGDSDDINESKQADQNKEDIKNHRKACYITESKVAINSEYKKLKAKKATKKQEALSKLKSTAKAIKTERKLNEDKYSDSSWYEYKVDDTTYNFICRTFSSSRRWGHDVELKQEYRTIGTARVTYLNRTWEMFEYQSCMLKAIDNAIKNGADENKMNALKEQVKAGRGLLENKKVESKEEPKDPNDLKIKEGVPSKEEPVPNTSTKIQERFSSKSFSEALSKYYSNRMSVVESAKVTKLVRKGDNLKLEANLITKAGKTQAICLEMKLIQKGASFNKYSVTETKGIVKENKANKSNVTLTTFKNKQNVIECKYILNK